MVMLKEMETIHTADGVMEQRFPNGALLRFFREDGHGELWHKDELLERRENVNVTMIFEMQKEACSLKGFGVA